MNVLFVFKPHMIEITDVVKASGPLPNKISGYFCSLKIIKKNSNMAFFCDFVISMFTENKIIYKLPSKEYINVFRKSLFLYQAFASSFSF